MTRCSIPLRCAVLGAVAVLTASCGFGNVSQVPLPGGADLGDHPYQVTASFTDVLDLVPQSAVKVNDVAVGKVAHIALAPDGRSARVIMNVNGNVSLPANASARLRQSSILGEKFVELAPPELGSPMGKLGNDAVIPIGDSSMAPQIEEVFGALSLLLNGGGVGQIQNITHQLNNALGGNVSAARSVLANLNTFLGGLDQQKAEISRALDGVNKLSATLRDHKSQIDTTLTQLSPGIKVLADQRVQLVNMLKALSSLTGVAVDTVNKSKDDLVADLTALAPTLRNLQKAGSALPQAMQMLFTFPFPDSALQAIKGDYLNTYLKLNAQGGGS